MASQSRLSPGIEFNEIDRSSYGKQDYSITGTTVFMTGFAAKGEDYTAQWINTIQTFEDLYGVPRNEPERNLYNGVREIIDRGGVAVVAKLPYANMSKDAFTAVTYQLVNPMAVPQLSGSAEQYVHDISSVDSSITAVLSIGLAEPNATERISLQQLDKYRVSNSLDTGCRNQIKIVDITRCHYGKINLAHGSNTVIDDVECLGILPVITTAANAMFYQRIIPSTTQYDVSSKEERTAGLPRYMPVVDACNRSFDDVKTGFSQPPQYTHVSLGGYIPQNAAMPISAATLADQCVAKIAVEQFPDIGHMLSGTLDRAHVKQICVAVFSVFKDKSNNNKLNFSLLESFVGQLDRMARDERSGASDYIGDIVNANSNYINLFASVRAAEQSYVNAQSIVTSGQRAPILGFAECELDAHIDYAQSIIEPLNIVLSRVRDPNQHRIDIVVDAGITNVAAFASQHFSDKSNTPDDYDLFNADTYPFFQSQDYKRTGYLAPWQFEDSTESLSKWFAVMKKFDDFCKYERRDCMFIGDMFRPVVLDGNEKIVRNTSRANTIASALLPKLKYVSGLNSSYSAGYANWFYVRDDYSGDFFWCPPSIKAAGVYVYTDSYFHLWDAPAGFARGGVPTAVDISFNPANDDAGKVYQQAWNYATQYPVEGVILEGQKTFQLKPTALDRVNVRRLMLWIEKRVVAIARRFLYEGNTPYIRQRFVDAISPVLEEAKTGDGISDYAIRCDDALNDTSTVENNELKCVIAVRPVKTIEYIKIGFIVSNQSADVNEEVMK